MNVNYLVYSLRSERSSLCVETDALPAFFFMNHFSFLCPVLAVVIVVACMDVAVVFVTVETDFVVK